MLTGVPTGAPAFGCVGTTAGCRVYLGATKYSHAILFQKAVEMPDSTCLHLWSAQNL